MPIIHRFFDQLESIENEQLFCDEPIAAKSKLLVIGTFNPDDNSCEKVNTATWFYGRKQSKFWKYLPTALTGQSLHPSDGHIGHPQSWKTYCVKNKIVIIDLVKRININDILPNFGDREVECKINFDISNTDYFDINRAFQKIQFDKVIYSLTWSDTKINRLRTIQNRINNSLIDTGCILDGNQIKYCLTPSRNDAYQSWYNAIN